jgi:DNA polymerase
MTSPDLTLTRETEAMLTWWRAAGVDCDFGDDATAWLADAPLASPAPEPASGRGAPNLASAASQRASEPGTRIAAPLTTTLAPETPRRNLLGDSPPADLAAFQQWWLTAKDLAGAQAYPRISPRGNAGAALMVLVPQPEAADRERLLDGPQGRLLANILAAMGLDESAVYIAAALPCHTPLADLAGIAASGMDAVTAHHIALVRPARLLALGTGLAAMLGAPGAVLADQPLREINHSGGKVPVLVSETLEALMEMPRLKARFWRRWMEWSATC